MNGCPREDETPGERSAGPASEPWGFGRGRGSEIPNWRDPPSAGLPRPSILPSSPSPPTATPSTLPASSASAAGDSDSGAGSGRDVAAKTARPRAAPCLPGRADRAQGTARVSRAWRGENRLSETAVTFANARSPGTGRYSGDKVNNETRSVYI